MGDTSRLANKVLTHLQWALDVALTKSHRRQAGDDNPVWEGWVSRDELSLVVGGGDGARRARELRENGYPVESKMMKIGDRPKQAYYRVLEDEEYVAKQGGDKPDVSVEEFDNFMNGR